MNEKIQKSLAAWTPARVALESSGHSLATAEILKLQLATAQARDAVHATMDLAPLLAGLAQRNLAHLLLASAATSRADYLRNPSQGRTLDAAATHHLQSLQQTTTPGPSLPPATERGTSPPAAMQGASPAATVQSPSPHVRPDLVFVIADGLSALAVDRHALPLLDAVFPLLDPAWRIAPICVVEQARVAIADPIGEIFNAQASVILIGERPGLTSPDSLGIYITWHPRTGRTDAERNCISNIRPEGLGYAEAANLLHFYLTESRRLQQTGTLLKPSSAVSPKLA